MLHYKYNALGSATRPVSSANNKIIRETSYFYIAHLGVQFEIYPAHFPFDLRCQSGIYGSYYMRMCRACYKCPTTKC